MSKFKPSPEMMVARARRAVDAQRRPPTGAGLATTIVKSPAELSLASQPQELPEIEATNSGRKFALNCALLFLFFRFSFVHEFIANNLHIDLHILIILGTIAYAACLVSGNILAAYRDRLAWAWTAFALILVLATVTSTWRGGSLGVLIPYLRTIFPLLLLLPAAIATPQDVRKVLNVIGIGGTATILFGLVHRDFTQGRMDIGTEHSTIQDPNDFAAHLVMLMPAIAYLMFAKERNVVIKIFGAGVLGAALLEIMSTGSRGGFVALLITGIYVAVIGSSRVRTALLIGVPLLGLAALPLVPKQSFQRLASVLSSASGGQAASESAAARRALLMDSLKATAQHPLLGVGPGVFQEYQASMAAQKNRKGMWHETHNGYTQISSECGIPALLIYLTAVVMTFKSLKRAARSNLPIIPAAARTLSIMAVGFSASIIFLANGYKFNMLVIGAITISINQILLRSARAEG